VARGLSLGTRHGAPEGYEVVGYLAFEIVEGLTVAGHGGSAQAFHGVVLYDELAVIVVKRDGNEGIVENGLVALLQIVCGLVVLGSVIALNLSGLVNHLAVVGTAAGHAPDTHTEHKAGETREEGQGKQHFSDKQNGRDGRRQRSTGV
jgi:hypothetical protein